MVRLLLKHTSDTLIKKTSHLNQIFLNDVLLKLVRILAYTYLYTVSWVFLGCPNSAQSFSAGFVSVLYFLWFVSYTIMCVKGISCRFLSVLIIFGLLSFHSLHPLAIEIIIHVHVSLSAIAGAPLSSLSSVIEVFKR